jgi:sporulation protein YlmC with PRC-barrel domain
MSSELHLGGQVLDKGLVTADGHRAGKVDDLLLELDAERPGTRPPEVCAIITGPMALAQEWPRFVRVLVRSLYRLLGMDDPRPVLIPWSSVSLIHVVVRITCNHDDAGLSALSDALRRRFIDRIPGAQKGDHA